MVTITSFDGGEFDAHLVLPAGGYGPGIVVLQEIFGVNQFLRDVAGWYAAHGFVALVPDLFWRQERGVELTDKTEADWQKAFALYNGLDEARAVEDSAAAVEFLRRHLSRARGAVGVCLGGILLTCFRCAPARMRSRYYGVSIEKATERSKDSALLMLQSAGAISIVSRMPEAIHGAIDRIRCHHPRYPATNMNLDVRW